MAADFSQYLSGLAEVEADILNNSVQFSYCNEQSFNVLRGEFPVLVSAPHSGGMIRNGQSKSPEIGTASVAILLHKILGVSAAYTTGKGKLDPCSVATCDFKDALFQLVQERPPSLVLDIHALHSLRPMDFDIGSMHGASLLGNDMLTNILKRQLSLNGLTLITENVYPATNEWSITRWAFNQKIPSLQCEINSGWLLYPGADRTQAERFHSLTTALRDAISDFIGCYRPVGS